VVSCVLQCLLWQSSPEEDFQLQVPVQRYLPYAKSSICPLGQQTNRVVSQLSEKEAAQLPVAMLKSCWDGQQTLKGEARVSLGQLPLCS
jgi:hypothetical protein